MDLLRATICALCLAMCGVTGVAQDRGAAGRDARIKVTMTNGSILMGIARGGVLCERQRRDGFESAESTSERGAGIRVWYYQRMNGFLFVPHRLIEEVEIVSTLTPEQSAAITRSIVKGPSSSREVAKPRKASPERTKTGSEVQPKEASWTPGRKTLPAEPSSLLDEFPPDKGWGKERLGTIRRRESVEGIAPTAEERRFAAVYEDWDRAHRAATAKQPDPALSKPLSEPRAAPKLKR